MTKQRYELLDAMRGFSLINMIGYHLVWDLIYIFSVMENVMPNLLYIWQQFICISFIFISGFCWRLGRNHFKRGIIVFAGGFLVSVVTCVFTPKNIIIFGILTFLGSAALSVIILHKILPRINSATGFLLNILLFAFFRHTARGCIGFSFYKIELPAALYDNYLTAYLGFPFKGFSSADYFPVLPWIFLFISGYYAYQYCREHHFLPYFRKNFLPPLNFLGRKSLFIYLIHQPIIYSLLSVAVK